MGLVTSLLIGGALAGGFLLGRRGKGKEPQAASETLSPQGEETPEQQVAATNPPVAAQEEAENVTEARRASTRTRRRAAAGNAGRVTTGPGATPGVSAGGAPRSLIGY